jgi:hypothetical protein
MNNFGSFLRSKKRFIKTKAVEALRLQPLFSLTFARRANISHFAQRNISHAAGVFHIAKRYFTAASAA